MRIAVQRRRFGRLAFSCVICFLISGCAASPPSPSEGPALAGRIWDTHSAREVSYDAVLERAALARFLILGETHDNGEHHLHQAEILSAMLRAGRRPVLVMEQFDRENQAALDDALRRGERDPERIADAGRFDRKGWRWPDYRPLVELAIANALPIIAGNVSREEGRAIARSGRPAEGLANAPRELRVALERDIVEGHCGMRPREAVLAGMVEVQRARDARMAAALESAGERGAVLIAGAGHARRDRGAPLYLSAEARSSLLVIAFVEVEPGKTRPDAYADLAARYDLVWFTQRAEREDPCAKLPSPPMR
jgi:uncharacterized iron-regulated protein